MYASVRAELFSSVESCTCSCMMRFCMNTAVLLISEYLPSSLSSSGSVAGSSEPAELLCQACVGLPIEQVHRLQCQFRQQQFHPGGPHLLGTWYLRPSIMNVADRLHRQYEHGRLRMTVLHMRRQHYKQPATCVSCAHVH